jgi:hypothetical protein
VTQEGRPDLGEAMWISRLRAVVLLLRAGGGAALRARLFGWRAGNERRWVVIVVGRQLHGKWGMMSGFESYVLFLSILSHVSRMKWIGERMDPLCYNTRKKTDKKK